MMLALYRLTFFLAGLASASRTVCTVIYDVVGEFQISNTATVNVTNYLSSYNQQPNPNLNTFATTVIAENLLLGDLGDLVDELRFSPTLNATQAQTVLNYVSGTFVPSIVNLFSVAVAFEGVKSRRSFFYDNPVESRLNGAAFNLTNIARNLTVKVPSTYSASAATASNSIIAQIQRYNAAKPTRAA